MRSRILPAVGISAIALVAAAALAPGASAANAPGVGHSGKAGIQHYSATKTCYSQGTTLDGVGVASQNFESSFDAYDNAAADDFKVAKKCKIKTVVVAGQYSIAGPVTDVTVTYYKDKSGKPGSVIKSVDGTVTADSAGTLTIKTKTVKLKKGTDWVSVVANLDFSTGGQWYWDTASDGSGSPAQWENPGGGFGLCPTWDSVATCNGATNPNLSFSLS